MSTTSWLRRVPFSKHLLRAEASILNVGTEPGRGAHAAAFQKGNLSA